MILPEVIREEKVDVLIIGAGAAGVRTAIALHHYNISCKLVTKREFGDAHTIMASGGINASLGSLDQEDNWGIHAADTLREGHFLNDPKIVEHVCKFAPEAVKELDKWGCPFNKTDANSINQRFFGAQSFRRTCFVGDRTGKAILDTLVSKAKSLKIPCQDGVYIFHILKAKGRVVGALGLDKKKGDFIHFKSSCVVLAAGGYASIYERSSSRKDENLGDTIHLSYHAGAKLMDMEMVQFHPTGMTAPESYIGKLVTEAVRGEGGFLFNNNGDRFMTEYSPEKKELDARDEVARAIAKEIEMGNGTEEGGVYLDITHKDADFIKARLPKMYNRFLALGVDMSKEAIQVAPTCHYSMGGAEVDLQSGATNVPGLFAVGEAISGMHGANRLGGNSLIETLVLGNSFGQKIAETFEFLEDKENTGEVKKQANEYLQNIIGCEDPGVFIQKIKKLMWNHAGIIRKETYLRKGLEELEALKAEIKGCAKPISKLSVDLIWQNLDLRNVVLSSELVLKTALYRKESRGAHYREDYPRTEEDWKKNILVYMGKDGRFQLETKLPGPVSEEVEKALQSNYSLSYHQLE
ncbi:L-aspartate oxidase [Pleomorphovibrio marinus]|uniref:L-aspartate oxidase n=1 Tax=Pleomorphovibrio marinus TaxID=2164132 RepID=UPI000E0A2E2C|nr:FAD-binding protein [Pleomorphovibrio marinus]